MTLQPNMDIIFGLCFAHAHKCVFFEMDSERRLKPCGRIAIAGDFCRLHEHRREEVEEERKAEEELQRDVERAVTSDESSFLSRASELVARVVPSQPRTCKGTTKGNTPCRRPPERGRDYCNSHKDQDPKKDGEREPESDAPQTENIVDEVEHSGTSDALTTGNHRCQGRRRYDGENCLLRPRIGSKYCRHHQDQDPNYETDQLLHKFEKYVETRNVIEQTEMLEEVLDDVDEYALVTYTLLKSSNQRSAKISSMMGFRKPKTRQVDLTIYPSTLIFQYPDEQDNKDKVLDTYKLSQITSVVISAGQNPSTGLRTMRLRCVLLIIYIIMTGGRRRVLLCSLGYEYLRSVGRRDDLTRPCLSLVKRENDQRRREEARRERQQHGRPTTPSHKTKRYQMEL